MIEPQKYKRKHVIRGGKIQSLIDYILSMRITTDAGSGLESEETPSGTKLWLSEPREIPIKITATDGVKYAWNAVRATPDGFWLDMTSPAGTLTRDWAIEENVAVAAVPQIVLGRREEWSHRMTFSRDTCG